LLDLDDVLADFMGAALRCHGWTWEEFEEVRKPGTWDMTGPMRLSHEAFWEPIRTEGEDFWANLDPLPWFDAVIKLVESVCKEWYIVSSPPNYLGARSGKEKWLRKAFGNDFDRYLLTPHKHLLANPQTVLIDDKEDNLFRFITSGGGGIIFPTRGNYRWPFADDPVQFLRTLLY